MYASISFKIVRQFFPVAAGIKEMCFFMNIRPDIRPFWKYDIRQETVTKKPSPDIRSKFLFSGAGFGAEAARSRLILLELCEHLSWTRSRPGYGK